MAVYPGGYNEHRSAQIRRILYISIVVIVVGVIAIAGYILLRNRGGSQEVAPEPQAGSAHSTSLGPRRTERPDYGRCRMREGQSARCWARRAAVRCQRPEDGRHTFSGSSQSPQPRSLGIAGFHFRTLRVNPAIGESEGAPERR